MHPVSLRSLLNTLEQTPSFDNAITAKRILPERPESSEPLPENIHPRLRGYLQRQQIPSLYSHQAEAWRRVTQGKNICLATPTASGKSLCYHLPVLDCHVTVYMTS